MISAVDHVVLVVNDFETALAFYREVLGCQPLGVDEWRQGQRRFPSLMAGRTMINVHEAGRPVAPEAAVPTAGSEDLCFVWQGPIKDAVGG